MQWTGCNTQFLNDNQLHNKEEGRQSQKKDKVPLKEGATINTKTRTQHST